jgi:hypothetical protein
MGRDVFISYAEEDKTVAALACKRLEDVGMSCWMAPRDIRLDGTELTGDLEYFLSSTQWLDVSRGRIEEQLAPLPRYVRMLLSPRRGVAARPPLATRAERTKREIHRV